MGLLSEGKGKGVSDKGRSPNKILTNECRVFEGVGRKEEWVGGV